MQILNAYTPQQIQQMQQGGQWDNTKNIILELAPLARQGAGVAPTAAASPVYDSQAPTSSPTPETPSQSSGPVARQPQGVSQGTPTTNSGQTTTLSTSTPAVNPTIGSNAVGVVRGLVTNVEDAAVGTAVSSSVEKIGSLVAGEAAGGASDLVVSGALDLVSIHQGYKTAGVLGAATATAEAVATEATGALGTKFGGPALGIAAQAATNEAISVGGQIGGTLLYDADPGYWDSLYQQKPAK